MKILSWDVGIYNLSYCIIEKNNETSELTVLDWDIVNLVDNELMKKNRNLLFENIPRKLHELPQLLDVDIVVIENQPSLKNPQMKSIQMILYSYFLILGKIIGDGEKSNSYINTIDFCSASNKLKIYDGPEIILKSKKPRKKKTGILVDQSKEENNESNDNIDSENKEEQFIEEPIIEEEPSKKKGSGLNYADKKKLAIEHAKYFIEKVSPKHKEFFESHKKKDDLSDSFLQGLYYLEKMKSKIKKQKK
jgi:hypothetical protein